MNNYSATFYGAGGVLTTSTTCDGHCRNASADSGHFDTPAISENTDSESAMTDLSQEDGSTDPSLVGNKLSNCKSWRAHSGSNSVDSGVGGSIDEDDALQFKGEDYPDYPESVGSQAIRESYCLLVEVFSHQESADNLASDLYSKFLIENTIQGEVRIQGITDEEKARRLLNAVMSKLRTSPTDELFEHFISVLESYHSCCDIVVRIRGTYQKLQQSQLASSNCNSHAHHHSREELVYGNSTHCQTAQYQRDLNRSRASESLDGCHQEQKSSGMLIRQRSISSREESYNVMIEIEPVLKKWGRESKPWTREIIRKCMDISVLLLLAIFLLLLLSCLIMLLWTFNADVKKIEQVHPTSTFDEKIVAIYNKEKLQVTERLLMIQRQLLLQLLKLNGGRHSDTYASKTTYTSRRKRS